jgi:hypothetical protein
MNLVRSKYAQLAAMLFLLLTWAVLRNTGANVTSGTLVASPEFRQLAGELVTNPAAPGLPTITQPLNLDANQDYVIQFEAAASREAHIVAGFASGATFAPGTSFSLDLDPPGNPVNVRRVVNAGHSAQNLQLKIACSGSRVLIRDISVRRRNLFAAFAAWLALALAFLLFAIAAFRLVSHSTWRLRLPLAVSWAWPAITAIAVACSLRNLALPRPFVFGDELLYAILSRFCGREALLIGNPLTPVLPNLLYFHLYQKVFFFGENYLEAAKVLNVIFFAIALAALYATVRLFQARKTALLVVAMTGFAGIGIYSACFMPESMYFCLFSLLIFVFVRYIHARPLLASTLCGICLAAEILVKPHGLILIAPWLIAVILLRLPWRQTAGMALCFILSVAVGTEALNFILSGELALGLGTGYGPIAARSVTSGSLDRIIGLMGAHLAALSTLYALPLLVTVCYLLQPSTGLTEKAVRLRALALLILTCLITLIFTTSKFTTLWPTGDPDAMRLHVRYYDFLLPWLVALFFCTWPELDWSKRRHRQLFLAGGIVLGALSLLATINFGASHVMTFVDFPDIFWFYPQATAVRYFVAVSMAATLILYLVLRPASWLYGMSFGLVAMTGSLWVSHYMLALPPMPGDVAGTVFRPLIDPEALDRGVVLVPNGSDLDSYRLMFHLLGAYDVAVQDPTTPIPDSVVEDKSWIIVAGQRPVKFSFQRAVSMGRYTLYYLLPEGASRQYSEVQGPPMEAIEEVLKDPKPFVHIDILGPGRTVEPVVPATAPLRISGWAFDPKHDGPAGAVAVVIDQTIYPATYGEERQDVAAALRNPSLAASGYTVEVPREAMGKGVHEVSVRVIGRNRRVYWTGPRMKFTAK